MDICKSLEELSAVLDALKQMFHKRKWQFEQLLEQRASLEANLSEIQKEINVLTQVKLLLQLSAERARQVARENVERLVTQALQYVFGADLEFIVTIEEKRERPEAEFLVASTYGGTTRVVNRPEDSRGGGIVDVIGLALRAAMLEGSRASGPLLLDEPAKHVSEDFSRNVGLFLKHYSENFGRQVIMITHNKHMAFMADTAYRVELQEGVSTVLREPNRTANCSDNANY